MYENKVVDFGLEVNSLHLHKERRKTFKKKLGDCSSNNFVLKGSDYLRI